MKLTNPICHQRRGSVYVIVLGTSLTVLMIGLSALAVVRSESRAGETCNDLARARLYAQSAIEMGFLWIREDPDWRNNRPNGAWAVDQPIDGGTFTLEVIDPNDGDLIALPNEAVLLTGTGVQGRARFKLEVTVVPDNGGFEISPGTWRRVVD